MKGWVNLSRGLSCCAAALVLAFCLCVLKGTSELQHLVKVLYSFGLFLACHGNEMKASSWSLNEELLVAARWVYFVGEGRVIEPEK